MTAARRWTPVGLAALLLPAALAAQEPPTVRLDEAIELALRVQPAVVQARGTVTNAGAARREVVGSWLPQLSAGGSWGYRSAGELFINGVPIQDTVSRRDSYNASLTGRLTIFDGFQRLANGRAAAAELDRAHADLTDQQFRVTLQAKQAFFNVLAADELLRVSNTRIERAEQQLKVSKEKLAAGSATRSDTLRSAVELGNARLQLLTAQATQASTRASLGQLIGYDGPVQAVGDSSLFDLPPLDTAALRSELLRTAPSVVSAEANAKAAAATVAVARAAYFPEITGTFSQSWNGPVREGGASAAYRGFTDQWRATIGLSWSIFNGFTREAAVTRSDVSRETAQAQAEDARRLASAQLTQQLATLESSRAQIDISRQSLAAAQEDLRVVQERYRLGAATIVDVLTSQITLDDAEIAFIRARLDFLVARAELEALLGREL